MFIGAVIGLVVLVDIFLVVLYARAHTGILARFLTYGLWRLLVRVSKLFGSRRQGFLTLSGPIILLSLLFSWGLLLSMAAALIIHPGLGTGVRSTQGQTPTDFITALYVAGTSLSFVGASDFAPTNSAYRLFFLLTSMTGVTVVSLTVTYLMELYGSLRDRNAHGLKVHLMSAETGDAAEILARLGPEGMFEEGYQILAEWANQTAQVKETHGFYDMLFYFRFREAFYSVSRTALTSLDMIALIKSALDEKEYGWLRNAAAVEQLGRGTMLELKELRTLATFAAPEGDMDAPPDPQTRARWHRRFDAALERLEEAGVKTNKKGVEQYISLRTQWDRYIRVLAPKFAYEMDEVDPALAEIK
ncbi:MAG: ion channel [Anaerolineae bacterium]